MESKSVFPSHSHIRWHFKNKLDWEYFETSSEALSRASDLAQHDEGFTIEEVSAQCALRKAKIAQIGEQYFKESIWNASDFPETTHK